jgi:hypothetical protein
MQIELGETTVKPSTEKKVYETPVLVTHGSVAKLTKHSGGYSDISTAPCPWVPHHRHRWWECL